MPVKPPRSGSTHVDVDIPTSPNRSADVDTSLPGPSGHRGFDSGSSLDNSQLRSGAPGASDVDAILPAPAVVVHAASVETRPPSPQPSLDHYVTNTLAILPQVNSEGLRVIRQRTYAELSDGRIVLVAVDPGTGLYRARLPSELSPSGPVLLRDTDSGFWSLHEAVGSTTRAQIKKYFPEATDQHADDFIARFGDRDAAEAELKRIQLGYPQLDSELGAWEKAYRGHDAAERNRRLAIGAKIRRLYKWQGDTSERVHREGRLVGFKLNLNLGSRINQAPPVFSPRLSSVVALHLEGGAVHRLEGLFSSLSHIEVLEMHMSLSEGLPAGIEKLTELKVLDMSKTGLTLKSSDIDRFTSLTRLQELNLSNCNLLHAPSVRGLTELRVLDLSYTGISALPAGLSQSPGPSRLQVLDLHWNRGIQVAPDVTGMSELRVLDLTDTGINRLPVGLGSENGPMRLEVLRLGANSLFVAPSLRGMAALQEVDLSNTRIDRFPEGITSEIPKTKLKLVGNDIESIPESLELRKGFDLAHNPISDPASLRRLISARRQTGTDVWLGEGSTDLSANLWLRNVPQAQIPDKLALWDRWSSFPESDMMLRIRHLSRTPEFQIERMLLQRRVWAFLKSFDKADPVEQAHLRVVAGSFMRNEPILGLMLDKLEAEIQKFDAWRQHSPLHHSLKRPKLE